MRTNRDYYELLGVARDASADEIRRAHRKLVRELHPDVNKTSDAAERFAAVQEAYEVLSDDKKRALYNQLGHAAFRNGAQAARGAGAGHTGRPGGAYTWSNMGGDASGAGDAFDASDISSIFEELFGQNRSGFGGARRGAGGAAGPRQSRRASARGADARATITVSFHTATHGGAESLRLSRGGDSETIEVRIPKGVADGAKLRIRGKGEAGHNGGAPGDLILTVRVAPHPLFRSDGLDVMFDLPVTIAEAALGATVTIPTPRGGKADLKVPPGAGSGTKLRVRGQGVEDAKGRKGDLYAILKIIAPEHLSDEDRAALAKMLDTLSSPRTEQHWP